MKTNSLLPLLIFMGLLLLSSCAPDANPSCGSPDPAGDTAGFWMGIWHGLIAPVTFIISLFSDKVGVYEVFNNGNWYNFGFLLGLCVSLGGSGRGSHKVKMRRRSRD